MRTPSLLGATAGALLAAVAAFAEDTVVVATGRESTGRTRIKGEIVDYTGRALVLRRSSGREESIPAARVISIESSWTQEHEAADQRFGQRRYREALALYRQAVKTETRTWARRKILARCVTCYHNTGQVERAGDTFAVLYGSDPTSPYFSTIPLAWKATQPSATLEQRARQWMGSQQPPPMRLLGASWLLSGVDRPQAVTTLRQLLSDADARVVFLAESQLWRTRTVTTAAEELQRWENLVRQMPPDLRGGPYFVLGQALARQRQPERAALSLMRVPIHFPEQYDLAAESLLAAAGQLERMDRAPEALRAYRELASDYSAAACLPEAKARMQRLIEASGTSPSKPRPGP